MVDSRSESGLVACWPYRLFIHCAMFYQIHGKAEKTEVASVRLALTWVSQELCFLTIGALAVAKCYLVFWLLRPLLWSMLSKCYVLWWLVPSPWKLTAGLCKWRAMPAQFLGSLCFGCCQLLSRQNSRIYFRFLVFQKPVQCITTKLGNEEQFIALHCTAIKWGKTLEGSGWDEKNLQCSEENQVQIPFWTS